jgi:hypothetical protein
MQKLIIILIAQRPFFSSKFSWAHEINYSKFLDNFRTKFQKFRMPCTRLYLKHKNYTLYAAIRCLQNILLTSQSQTIVQISSFTLQTHGSSTV